MGGIDASRWHRLIEHYTRTVLAASPERSPNTTGRLNAGFLFSGLAQEITPRQLLLDSRLTPLERNAWQILRMLTAQGMATPRYEDLQPFLSSAPCGGNASRETISRMLTVLRLTRWLTLVEHPRNQVDGRFAGNIYVLHDEPLTHRESIELDQGYLELLGNSLSHQTKTVRVVAEHVANELMVDESVTLTELPSRLATWAERLIHSEGLRESELGDITPVRRFFGPGSDTELGAKAAPHHAVRNPNADSTVLGIKESTVPREREREGPLRWPAELRLSPSEQHACSLALSKLPIDMRQPVLNEAQARCASGSVRKPAAYLLGLIQKALTGDFKPWAAVVETEPSSPAPAKDPAPVIPPREPKQRAQPASPLAQSYLAELRSLAQRKPPD